MPFSVPESIQRLLRKSQPLEAVTQRALSTLFEWIGHSRVVFFPEYTDHGPRHIEEVFETASRLITPASWPLLTAADMSVLLLSSVLHDCALHLSEDGFVSMLGNGATAGNAHFQDVAWSDEWNRFLAAASRFDGHKLRSLFGSLDPVTTPSLDPVHMTGRDRLLIGEFIRQHHPRIAFEIAFLGIPGAGGTRVSLELPPHVSALSGFVARSHGLDLRRAVDVLNRIEQRETQGIHTSFLMALLRIADYIQIHKGRAPAELLRFSRLRSPLSREEWRAHDAIVEINWLHEDPESVLVSAQPGSISTYLKVKRLLEGIQGELDECWATLGEVYGRFVELNSLGLRIRRIRSNLDDPAFSASLPFVDREARFDTARGEVLKLLVRPLYGDHPEYAIRELLQNAVDATREWRHLRNADGAEPLTPTEPVEVDVTVTDDCATLVVRDRGVGMTVDTIVNYFLKAGASFRSSEAWKREFLTDGGHSLVLRSGRFGVGVLAAFMLGDDISVTTRHTSSPRGIRFHAGLDDEEIELRYVEAEVGTNISVAIKDATIVERLKIKNERYETSRDDWDFYCLDDVKVIRRLDSKTLEQRWHIPKSGGLLPAWWRRIDFDGYEDIQWTYGLGLPRHDWNPSYLFCNDITVSNHRFYDSNAGRAGRETWLSFQNPTLSVFDPSARLPLNLQRTGLAGKLPFGNELTADIVMDFVAWLTAALPERPSRPAVLRLAKNGYPGLQTRRIGQAAISGPWIGWSSDGWVVLDPTIAGWTGKEKIVFDPNWRQAEDLMARQDDILATSVYVPLGLIPKLAREQSQFIAMALPSEYWGYGVPHFAGCERRATLIKEEWIEYGTTRQHFQLSDVRKFAKHLADGWCVVSTEDVPAPFAGWLDVAKYCSEHGLVGCQVWLLDALPKYEPSPLAAQWERCIGKRAIPFKHRDRTRLSMDSPPKFVEYVNLHRAMSSNVSREDADLDLFGD